MKLVDVEKSVIMSGCVMKTPLCLLNEIYSLRNSLLRVRGSFFNGTT